MIEVEAISKKFGKIQALRDVSFQVKQGEILGLLGPNGSGKTTMMRILACFMPPSSGRVLVEGLDVEHDSLAIRRRLGYFLERVSIYPDMRVTAFLNFAARIKGVPPAAVRGAVDEAAESCGLAKVMDRVIGNLSKGYCQRVGLAQCLLNKPAVLLLDEPTAGVDPSQVVEIRALIQRLAGERTVIFSSHILSEVSQICSKIVIMQAGEVGAVDTPENLGAQLDEGAVLRVVIEAADPELEKSLGAIPGLKQVIPQAMSGDGPGAYVLHAAPEVDLPAALCELAAARHWVIRELTPIRLTLEEIFLRVIRKN